MFAQILPLEVFAAQSEFIKAMEAKLDFYWWADTLIKEEAGELRKAHEENEGMSQIFKEAADLIYVYSGFVNVMPLQPNTLISDEKNEHVQAICEDAMEILGTVSGHYKIPIELFVMAFDIVHKSNMSKLDDDGNPIRREDGKIMKGPNYVAPDMSPVVKAWEEFVANLEKETPEDAPISE